MTPTQYKQAIASLGLSQERAGVWLGYAGRTSQNWALGAWPVPRVVELLLTCMVSRSLMPSDLELADTVGSEPSSDPPDKIPEQR